MNVRIKRPWFSIPGALASMLVLMVICVGFILGTEGCAKTPPNLSPQASVAFKGTQAIHYLDRVRDAANDAHHTTPPLISAATTLKVVSWHQTTIRVVHEAPAGWQATVMKALDELPHDLPAEEAQVLAPYIAAAKLVLQEVVR